MVAGSSIRPMLSFGKALEFLFEDSANSAASHDRLSVKPIRLNHNIKVTVQTRI
jgi:hypothetical protein